MDGPSCGCQLPAKCFTMKSQWGVNVCRHLYLVCKYDQKPQPVPVLSLELGRRIELEVNLRKMPRVVRGMVLRKQTTGSSWEDFTSKSQRTTRGKLLS